MKSRFEQRRQKGDNYDPLVIDEFDWDNEWVNPLAEPVQGHRGCDDLTWEHVDEAVGASRTLQGRNLPRTLRRGDVISYSRRHTSSSTRRVVEEGEPHSNSDTEDEDEDFVIDDEEVDDYGEAPPDDMESDGGNMDGNDLDAFDIDDY